MENLPEKKQNTEIQIYKPVTALEKRRQISQIPEVVSKLKTVEKYIFEASTKELISEMSDQYLTTQLKTIFKLIANDVGYRIDEETWKMTCTRLFKFLKMYHGTMALAEIPLAFELVASGELDQYLPTDAKGNPDKNHYQQFNVDYFSRVLKAYKSKQNEVVQKAIENVPKLEFKPDEEIVKKNHNNSVEACRLCFENYREKKELFLDGLFSMFVWNWLISHNLVSEPEVSEENKQAAFDEYLRKSVDGLVNKYTAAIVRNEGIESKEIKFPALELARRDEIKKCFDNLIKEKVNINQYLNYK